MTTVVRIVQATRELVEERGSSFRVQDVAVRAACSVGTVYRIARSKEDLIAEALIARLETLEHVPLEQCWARALLTLDASPLVLARVLAAESVARERFGLAASAWLLALAEAARSTGSP